MAICGVVASALGHLTDSAALVAWRHLFVAPLALTHATVRSGGIPRSAWHLTHCFATCKEPKAAIRFAPSAQPGS